MQNVIEWARLRENMLCLFLVSVLTVLMGFAPVQAETGSELPFGTVAVCKEDASTGLVKRGNRWESIDFANKTLIFKKVRLEGAYDRNQSSLCPTDLKDEKDIYNDSGKPMILHRCYQLKRADVGKTIERGCEEIYDSVGALMSVNCDWGYAFHPDKELFSWPNPPIFSALGEYGPTFYNVAHGTCSRM